MSPGSVFWHIALKKKTCVFTTCWELFFFSREILSEKKGKNYTKNGFKPKMKQTYVDNM